MSNIQLPAGKFVPPIQPNPDISRVVQRSTPQQPSASFSDTLQSRMNKISTTPQSAPQTASPSIQAIPIPETMPSNLSTGPDFESGYINNWQQYNASGGISTPAPSAAPMRTASQPAMNAAMMNASNAATPIQTQASPYQQINQQPYTASSAQPTQAMNSALARGLGQAYNVSSEPIQEQPIHVPAPEVVLTPEEAAQLDAIIAGQPIQQSRTDNRKLQANSQYQQQQQLTQQSNDSKEKKGFFKSVGSFFKNIASGLTLGFYRPDNAPAPQGLARVAEPVKRIFWDAPKSLIVDAPVGAFQSMKGSFNGDANSQQQNVAVNSQAQRVIDAGEKAIASRKMNNFTTGSKLHSRRMA